MSQRGARQQKARPVTSEWLFKAAAHYLERYSSTAANLQRVLERKVARRTATAATADVEPAAADHGALVAATVARFVELGLLDDRSFADAKLVTLRRRGASMRMAAAKLAQKGVEREMVEAVLAADETSDREAAFAFVKRRRFGPYRTRDREARREKDIAAVMRAGFSYADAVAAVDAEQSEG